MIYQVGADTGVYCIEGAGARVYFIARPEPMLVDAGAPGHAETIFRALAQVGVQPIHLKKIILTHHHLGHVGSLGALKRRSGAIALAHYADAPYITGKRPRRQPRHPVERVFQSAVGLVALPDAPVDVEWRLDDGAEINGWRVLHTPGHTPGHICLWRGEMLISGDLLLATAGAFRELPHSSITDVVTSRVSIRRAAELPFTAILPGHNPPYVFNARTKVQELTARLEG